MKRKTFSRAVLALVAAVALPLGANAQSVKFTLGHGAATGNPRVAGGADGGFMINGTVGHRVTS